MRCLSLLLLLGCLTVSCAGKNPLEAAGIDGYKNRDQLSSNPSKYASATYGGFDKLCKDLRVDVAMDQKSYMKFVLDNTDMIKNALNSYKSEGDAAKHYGSSYGKKECELFKKSKH